jgi:hypothetical protein
MDCGEDQTLLAVLVGMLREAERDAARINQTSVGKDSGTGSAQRRLAMWIETEPTDMIERVTVEHTT